MQSASKSQSLENYWYESNRIAGDVTGQHLLTNQNC